MIPISRVEMYLAKICGEDVELPIPQTRKEVFLAIIAGESYEKPVPSSRVELYLAKILGDDVPLPIPQSREEIFLAKIAGVEYPLPYPESRIEYWLHKWATYEEWETITGNPVSFTAKAAPLRQLSVAFSPVQAGSGDPSPDNVRPISGWSSLHVYDDPLYAGVIEWNQLVNADTENWAEARATFNHVYDAVGAAKVGHVYYIHEDSDIPSGEDTITYKSIGFWSASMTKYVRWGITLNSSSVSRVVRINSLPSGTTESDLTKIVFQFISSGGTGTTVQRRYRQFQIVDLTEVFGEEKAEEIYAMEMAEPGSGVVYFRSLFPHDYYPYNAGTETLVGTVNGMDTRSISISLGSTVYSGTLDVVTGVGEVTMASVDLGTQSWTKGGTSGAHWRFSAPTPTPAPKAPAVSAVANALCSVYRAVTANQTWTGAAKGIAFNSDGKILIADEDYADETALTTALTGQTLVYELATPIPIQLTPQEVESLAGDNTMWTDAQNLEVTYRSN